jgi:hypothetical protein
VPTEDVFMGSAELGRLDAALAARPRAAGPGRVWRVEGATHLLGVHAEGDFYYQRIRSFLDETLCGSPGNGGPTANHAAAGVNAGGGAV